MHTAQFKTQALHLPVLASVAFESRIATCGTLSASRPATTDVESRFSRIRGVRLQPDTWNPAYRRAEQHAT